VSDLTVTVLGSANAWAPAGGATAGYLARTTATTMLIDCGHGVLARLRDIVDPQLLDAVFISHLHADHCADLISLAYMLRYHPHDRQDPHPQLWIPAGEREPLRAIARAFGDEDAFDKAFDIRELHDGGQVRVGDLTLHGAAVPHPRPTLALDVRSDSGGRFTYGADCEPNPQLVELADSTPLLLIEATMPEPGDGHLSAATAAAMAAAAGARRVVLIHVCDAFDDTWVFEQAQREFGPGVTIAKSGDRYTTEAFDSADNDRHDKDPAALRDLIATLWLYIGRSAETQLTTEQKELLADVVEAADRDHEFVYDRWWRPEAPNASGDNSTT